MSGTVSTALPFAVALGLAGLWSKYAKTHPPHNSPWFRALSIAGDDGAFPCVHPGGRRRRRWRSRRRSRGGRRGWRIRRRLEGQIEARRRGGICSMPGVRSERDAPASAGGARAPGHSAAVPAQPRTAANAAPRPRGEPGFVQRRLESTRSRWPGGRKCGRSTCAQVLGFLPSLRPSK